ncbi:MAG: hypothetical protein V4685_16650 [Bacteroidota bacterium]
MKALKFLTAVLFLSAVFTACKKDEIKSPTLSMEGKWSGFKGFYGDTMDNDILWNIKANGIIEETNTSGAVKGSGTWTLNGTTFTAHYQFKAPLNTIYSFKGSYDKNAKKITGTWGFDDSDSGEGNWYTEKQP